jgi:phage terminase large subunit GpA-like protein
VELTRCKASETWTRVIEALRPPPIEPFSVWIEREVCLPEGLRAEPGKVTLWPPQVEIANSIGDPEVERVTWLKSVRSGFTFLVACAVARHVLDDAAPIIVLMPTEADARGMMVDDIEPLFSSSPDLIGLLPEPSRDERGRSTLLQRFYPGGSVKAISSKAARNLRRHTARCVYADEVDAMECVEGDPLKLAERRTLTYRNRKHVAGSSPKIEDTSLVAKLYAVSLSKTLSGEDSPELWNRGMLAGDGCDPQAADWGATKLYYVARAA